MREIVVTVEGGLVQCVEFDEAIDDIVVRVKDYDDQQDIDPDDPDYDHDDRGHYCLSTWLP